MARVLFALASVNATQAPQSARLGAFAELTQIKIPPIEPKSIVCFTALASRSVCPGMVPSQNRPREFRAQGRAHGRLSATGCTVIPQNTLGFPNPKRTALAQPPIAATRRPTMVPPRVRSTAATAGH